MSSDRHGIPADATRVVVFGGTFDPPHLAHLELSDYARRMIGAEWVLFVPASCSPHKAAQPRASMDHRVKMLESCLEGRPASVSRIEAVMAEIPGQRIYTVDTLEALRRDLGEDIELRLLIGTDQLAAFDRWHAPDRIVEIAPPVVVLRAPFDTVGKVASFLSSRYGPDEVDAWLERVLDSPLMDMAATGVRAQLESGELAEAGDDLPEAVRAYIEAHGLYTDD